MSRKRKIIPKDETKSDSELSYSDESEKSFPEIKINEKEINKNKLRIQEIKKKMLDMKMSYEKVLELNLCDEEIIWFFEHIDIMESKYTSEQEKYTIKTMLYEKYKELQNISLSEKIKKLKNDAKSTNNLLERIVSCTHPDHIKLLIYNKYMMIKKNKESSEYAKMIEWIETILELPTTVTNIDISDMSKCIGKLMEALDNKLFGLNHVKEKVIESYCAMLTNDKYKKNIIALVGPPGVGKTALASSIAESLNLPFEQISMGCIKDPATLIGHTVTYIGSRPGIFVDLLKKMKTLNGVILLDEIDKIVHSKEGGSITSTLLHVLDKTQNTKFRDMYFPEIPIDLSKILFIVALNDESLVDPILKDRMSIIKIDGYNIEEKINICKKFIIPKALDGLNFTKKDIIVSDKVIEHIINKTCKNNSGVRELEKAYSKIFEKINILKQLQHSKKKIKLSYHIEAFKLPFVLTIETADMLLQY